MLNRRSCALLLLSMASINVSSAQDILPNLARTDPNAFVRAVQTALRESGTYTGPVDGLLSRSTISAINNACEAKGVLYECGLGPLSERGASAVIEVVSELEISKPDAEVAAVDAEPPTFLDSEKSGETIVWRQNGARNGVEIVGSSTDETFTADIRGIATEASWTNIDSRTRLKASEGENWTMVLSSQANLADGVGATARIAAFGEGDKYLGEVGEGAPLSGSSIAEYSTSGVAPVGTVFVTPYIQLRYLAGLDVEGALSIYGAQMIKG